MALTPAELADKYNNMNQQGVELTLAGNPKPFAGPQEVQRQNLVAVAYFGNDRGLKSILYQLSLLEKAFGHDFILAGRDFDAHCTVGQAVMGGVSEDPNWGVAPVLEQVLNQAWALRLINLRFNRLIISPSGEVLLAGEAISEAMAASRLVFDALTHIYGREKLITPDIQHATLVRHRSFGKMSDVDRAKFVEVVETLDAELQRVPLVIEVSKIDVSSTFDQMSRPAPVMHT